jgi:hypothetical protein
VVLSLTQGSAALISWHSPNNRGKIAMSKVEVFGVGMLFGIALGVLFAPRKGSETRARLKKKYDYFMGEVHGFASQAAEKVSEAASEKVEESLS